MAAPRRQDQTRLAYSPDELADQLGVTRTHIYNEIRRGNLPSFKTGRAVRIPAAAVIEMMGGAA